MLVAAAVCPHPPVLVPGIAAGATAELDDLRAACSAAVATLLSCPHDLLLVVGGAATTGIFAPDAWGSLHGYVAGRRDPSIGPGDPTLPLSLTVGSWLLGSLGAGRLGAASRREYVGVAADAEVAQCLRLGADLAGRAERVAMLVMGDGSARRTPKKGYLDDRAAPFDAAVAAALADGDPRALAGLDPGLAADLGAAGRAPWQVLAGAAGADGPSGGAGSAAPGWTSAVVYADAPYGVGYLVATWVTTASSPRLADRAG